MIAVWYTHLVGGFNFYMPRSMGTMPLWLEIPNTLQSSNMAGKSQHFFMDLWMGFSKPLAGVGMPQATPTSHRHTGRVSTHQLYPRMLVHWDATAWKTCGSSTTWQPALPKNQIPGLVNLQKAIENGHRNSELSHEKWWFSIVMVVYQRYPKKLE